MSKKSDFSREEAGALYLTAVLKKQKSIDAPNIYGDTALICAIRDDQPLNIIKELCFLGADIRIKDADNLSALYWAQYFSKEDVVFFLKEKGAKVTFKEMSLLLNKARIDYRQALDEVENLENQEQAQTHLERIQKLKKYLPKKQSRPPLKRRAKNQKPPRP